MPRKKSIKEIADDVMGIDSEDAEDDPPPPVERLPLDHPAIAITKPVLIDGAAVTRGAIPRDPLKIKMRLYIQVAELLHALETGQGDDGPVTMRERIAALTAIGRLQAALIDKAKDDDENAGSAIRKYAGAFKNGARQRKKVARSTADKLVESDREWGDESGAADGDGLDAHSDDAD